jgi:cytochrome P450
MDDKPVIRSIPKVKGLPILGVALDFQKNPLEFLRKKSDVYPDLFEFHLGTNKMLFTNNPEYIHHILLKNFKNYDKKNIMYKEMSILFGEATSVVDGDKWKEGYQLIQPSFTMKKVIPMFSILNESIEKLIVKWEKEAVAGNVIDVTGTMLDSTLEIIVNVMFGENSLKDQEIITNSFKVILNIIVDRIISIMPIPISIPTPQNLKYKNAIKEIDNLLYKIIKNKLNNSEEVKDENEFQDMLSQWVRNLKKSNNVVGIEKKLRDEVIGIFVAGHGSSATFLSWIFYHLANNPESQDKLFAEIYSVLGGRKPNFEDFEKLKYTKAVIDESMRITPPGWIVSRSNIEEDQLGPYKIPAKSMIFFSPYLLQNSKLYWDNPESFNPDRFFGENENFAQVMFNKCRFVPFTAGPRICTGKNMAEAEAMLFVTQIIQKFKIDKNLNQDNTLIGGFNLLLKDGIKLKMTLRN